MKEGMHPEYQEATITCACGNVIKTNWKGNLKRETTGGKADRCKKKYGLE